MFKFQNQHLSHVRRRRVVEAQGPAQLQHICESLLRGPEIQEAASPGCRGREHNAPFSELSCCVSSGQSQTWHFRDQADPGGCQGSLKSPLFSYCMLKPGDVPHCSPAWSQRCLSIAEPLDSAAAPHTSATLSFRMGRSLVGALFPRFHPVFSHSLPLGFGNRQSSSKASFYLGLPSICGLSHLLTSPTDTSHAERRWGSGESGLQWYSTDRAFTSRL